jgi:hypothetical protein
MPSRLADPSSSSRILAIAVGSCLSFLSTACNAPEPEFRPPENTTVDKPSSSKPPNAKVATFWKWFAENAPSLKSEADLQNVGGRITTELGKVHAGVFAEVGDDGTERRLVISADGRKELFPFVQGLYDQRPNIQGWKIQAFRQRADPAAFSITLGDVAVDPSKVRFVSSRNDSALDVYVFIPNYKPGPAMERVSFLLLDHLLGEYDVETRVRGIGFEPLEKAPETARPIAELPGVVDALKAESP